MKINKILLFGANGLIGSKLKYILQNHNYEVETLRINSVNSEIVIEKNINNVVQQFMPDIIVNCAAVIGMKICYDNYPLAQKINSWLPHILAKISFSNNIDFIHLSTEAVFPSNSEGKIYSEIDKPNPGTKYGKTKFEGEINALKFNNSKIIRLPRVFDSRKQIIAKIISDLEMGKKVHVVDNFYSTPVLSDLVSLEIFSLIQQNIVNIDSQIIHITGNKRISLYNLVSLLCDEKYINNIKAVSSFYFDKNPVESPFLNGGLSSNEGLIIDLEDSIINFKK